MNKYMGRLIDADKLRAQFTEPADWLDINQTLVHKTGIWAEIDAAETVPAIPLDWINGYINWLNSISTVMAAADVNAIKSMLTKWRLDNNGPVCGPDYCEIG